VKYDSVNTCIYSSYTLPSSADFMLAKCADFMLAKCLASELTPSSTRFPKTQNSVRSACYVPV